MSLFLTTQHLEEADALADRVGIIDAGNLVAEGTPAELKRSIAVDVIIAHIDGDVAAAMKALAGMEGATSVDHYGSEISRPLRVGRFDNCLEILSSSVQRFLFPSSS